MKRNSHILILLLLSVCCFAQNGEKLLRFRTVSPDSTSVSGINVVNIVNEKSAKTNGAGEFSIACKPGDLLILQKETFEYNRRLIEEEDLKAAVIIIKMIPKPIELDAVVVTGKASDDLSRHKDHRKFTPAERKVYTATNGILDPVINAISGRTAMLKKEVDVEMKERLMARAETLYDDDYYVKTLGIPQEYIRDFQYYMIDDPQFVSALKAKNKTLMKFESARLATTYKQLMAIGKNKTE